MKDNTQDEARWEAVQSRDCAADGLFFYGVRSSLHPTARAAKTNVCKRSYTSGTRLPSWCVMKGQAWTSCSLLSLVLRSRARQLIYHWTLEVRPFSNVSGQRCSRFQWAKHAVIQSLRNTWVYPDQAAL